MSAAMPVASASSNRIPIIDIGDYLAGTPGADQALARDVARTCLDTGFLVISNHGVPQAIINRAFAAAATFFALDEPAKLALKIGAENIGYLPYGGQTVRTSTVHKNTKPNFSESFYITTPDPNPALGEADHDRNKWPPAMDEFKAATVAYFQTMRALAHRMLPAFALALDLPPDYFEADFAGPTSTVRLIEYAPQLQDEDDLFGFAPHTDGSFITLALSRPAIAELAPDFAAAFGKPIPADDPALRLLIKYLDTVLAADELADPNVARSVSAHILDLVALVLGARGENAEMAIGGARATV
jgi:isopenicillin N synthase-like dioxygenase